MKLQSALLQSIPALHHGFFTRQGGVSEGLYASLNCGPGSNDDAAHVQENRARVARNLGADVENLCTLHQMHSRIAHVAEEPFGDMRPQGDALVTKTPGIMLGVLAADCAPVLFCDPQAKIIGAAHAGRPGALLGIVQATVEAMQNLGASANAIHAAIGPCLAQPHHELPKEWRQRFLDQDKKHAQFFVPSSKADHWLFDLKAYVYGCLQQAGVGRIEVLPHDTYADEALFFSYRRGTHRGDPDYGRQLSGIMLA